MLKSFGPWFAKRALCCCGEQTHFCSSAQLSELVALPDRIPFCSWRRSHEWIVARRRRILNTKPTVSSQGASTGWVLFLGTVAYAWHVGRHTSEVAAVAGGGRFRHARPDHLSQEPLRPRPVPLLLAARTVLVCGARDFQLVFERRSKAVSPVGHGHGHETHNACADQSRATPRLG
jgi:hypothetical protein